MNLVQVNLICKIAFRSLQILHRFIMWILLLMTCRSILLSENTMSMMRRFKNNLKNWKKRLTKELIRTIRTINFCFMEGKFKTFLTTTRPSWNVKRTKHKSKKFLKMLKLKSRNSMSARPKTKITSSGSKKNLMKKLRRRSLLNLESL